MKHVRIIRGTDSLTKGKVYTVVYQETKNRYVIVDDQGYYRDLNRLLDSGYARELDKTN